MSSHLIHVNIKQIFSPNTVANLWIAKLKTLQCIPCIVKNVGASDIEIYTKYLILLIQGQQTSLTFGVI